ncbi:unnamed protein product [Acanthoscelides obtectus]|uniref:Uncharacterized protein n=1 Tax=Acanthoscelides obtectus TaxID=200917 RepID=A0A9P0MLZ2_ACAOB|nr:unnamed protein product [Acanthoscelides obtectus]CAK1664701.1 hypothetical protein AOBTE_LOCUS24424 [Acanthoscelides obtectus]
MLSSQRTSLSEGVYFPLRSGMLKRYSNSSSGIC